MIGCGFLYSYLCTAEWRYECQLVHSGRNSIHEESGACTRWIDPAAGIGYVLRPLKWSSSNKNSIKYSCARNSAASRLMFQRLTWWQKGRKRGQGSAGRGGGFICFSGWWRCWWSSCNLNFLALRWTSIAAADYRSWWYFQSYSRVSLVHFPTQHSIDAN